nr:hypothetical protein [uncultured Roseateles sp.]
MTKIFALTVMAAAAFSSGAMAATSEPPIEQIMSRQIAEANSLCKSADGLTTITTVAGRAGFQAGCDSPARGRYDVDVSFDPNSQVYKFHATFDDRWEPAFGMSIDLLRSYKNANPHMQLDTSRNSASVITKIPS